MSARKTACLANIGTQKNPRPCGQPIAKNMRAACTDHATNLIPTGEPGIYYRGGGYVVVWRYRGKQHKSFHSTWEVAKETRGERQSGERHAAAKERFDAFALQWVDNCQGLTARGFDDHTRAGYRRALELYAIPHFGTMRLSEIEREDVERLVAKLQRKGLRAGEHLRVHGPGPRHVQ